MLRGVEDQGGLNRGQEACGGRAARRCQLLGHLLTILGIAVFVCVVLAPQLYLRIAAAALYVLIGLLYDVLGC